MYQTTGEFLLILDADQIPKPEILDRTLGYFRDPNLAFVQTPQRFRNTPPGDPFGSEAPLFYGPILQGKDGWNSAYFCGSNAVLRREALMQIGVVWYARDLHRRVRRALRAAIPRLRLARRRLRQHPRAVRAIGELLGPVREARRSLRRGLSLQTITWNFQRAVERISRRMVEDDLRGIRAELPGPIEPAVHGLARRDRSPLAAIEPVRELLLGLDLDRAEEAEPVLPMSTVSVTEDMATALRIHGLGWRSVYHHEVLALGLGPEDLHTAMKQRLRWAQGTLQVLLRENPLVQPGLTVAQRLLYLGTMWSYLSGFAMIVYLLSPALYLCFGLRPVTADALQFLGYLAPVILANYALFLVVGFGLPTWRGQQYSLALFPLWIRAVVSTVGNVWFGRELGFVVTSKTRQAGNHWRLIWPQAGVMAVLAGSVAIGFGRLALGLAGSTAAVLVNAGWAVYSLLMLSVMLVAAAYRPPDDG